MSARLFSWPRRALGPATCLALALAGACGGPAKNSSQARTPEVLPPRTYSHYLRGRLLFEEGQYAEAASSLAMAKRTAPDEAPISRALAEALYQSGDRGAAERELAAARKRWPKTPAIWIASATLSARSRKFSEAEAQLQRAIALDAKRGEVLQMLGEAFEAQGNRKAARAVYKRLTRFKRYADEARYRLARVSYKLGDLEGARAHAEAAARAMPYHLDAWAIWASAASRLGRDDEAKATLRTPFDRSQGNAEVGEALCTSLRDIGDMALARRLVGILRRDDLSLYTQVAMGHWLLQSDDAAGALRVADALKGAKGPRAPIAELRAKALRLLGNEREAASTLLSVKSDEPGYPLLQAMLADVYVADGKAREAQALLELANDSHPNNPDLTMARARVAEHLGDLQAARKILTEAIAKHPGASRPLYALAELEARAGNRSAAIDVIRPVLKADPQNYVALNYIGYTTIGDTQSSDKDKARARDLLLRALERAPDSAFVLDSYGWFLVHAGELSSAEPLLERAVRLAPTEPEQLAHLAELRRLQGRTEEAEKLLANALRVALSPHARAVVLRAQKRLRASVPAK